MGVAQSIFDDLTTVASIILTSSGELMFTDTPPNKFMFFGERHDARDTSTCREHCIELTKLLRCMSLACELSGKSIDVFYEHEGNRLHIPDGKDVGLSPLSETWRMATKNPPSVESNMTFHATDARNGQLVNTGDLSTVLQLLNEMPARPRLGVKKILRSLSLGMRHQLKHRLYDSIIESFLVELFEAPFIRNIFIRMYMDPHFRERLVAHTRKFFRDNTELLEILAGAVPAPTRRVLHGHVIHMTAVVMDVHTICQMWLVCQQNPDTSIIFVAGANHVASLLDFIRPFSRKTTRFGAPYRAKLRTNSYHFDTTSAGFDSSYINKICGLPIEQALAELLEEVVPTYVEILPLIQVRTQQTLIFATTLWRRIGSQEIVFAGNDQQFVDMIDNSKVGNNHHIRALVKDFRRAKPFMISNAGLRILGYYLEHGHGPPNNGSGLDGLSGMRFRFE